MIELFSMTAAQACDVSNLKRDGLIARKPVDSKLSASIRFYSLFHNAVALATSRDETHSFVTAKWAPV